MVDSQCSGWTVGSTDSSAHAAKKDTGGSAERAFDTTFSSSQRLAGASIPFVNRDGTTVGAAAVPPKTGRFEVDSRECANRAACVVILAWQPRLSLAHTRSDALCKNNCCGWVRVFDIDRRR
jgi:hypothetical protein